jgi:spoIIIJ-associated protein
MDSHQDLIQQFFSYFGLTSDQIQIDAESDSLTITLLVDQTETGRYIGRFATTLDSLQLLISLMINHDQPTHLNVTVDVGGYRQERLAVLQDMASRIEAEVTASTSPRAFPPLSASDRRAIHLLYQDHATLTTYSEGEGQSRRLILAPKS